MGRTPCCDKNGLKKGPWTSEEDQKLMDYIHKHGYGNWRTLPKNAGLERCGKSCRLRWTNYLRPDIKRGRFSFEEEEMIVQLHSILGNKWSAIAARLPGRTDNEIKNYWNTHIRKRLLRMGIDPVTHSPRLDLLDLSSLLYNPNSHLNLSAMLAGAQPNINPQLLHLATSLLSSHQSVSSAFSQDTQFLNHQIQQQQQQQQSDQIHDMAPHNPFNGQILEQHQQHNLVDWQDNYIPAPSNFSYYTDTNVNDSEQPVTDNSVYYSTDNNFGAFVTPTSSPTPLNSNSTTTTYVNGGGTEDEREIISYCADMLEFDIPEILDVSDFACNNF